MNIAKFIKISIADLLNAFNQINIALILGWADILQRYRRSKLGPFWITISMGVTILGIGTVFGALLGSPMEEFLPFLAIGMILWGFILSTISEGCAGFISVEGIIKQQSMPFFLHLFRMLWRNIITLMHNIIIVPIVFLVFLRAPSWEILLVLPGFMLLSLNLLWVSMILAILCTRFRDLTNIVLSVIQLWFFVTPIVWQPELMIEKGRTAILDWNPFYHLIEIVRAPLLGQMPSSLNWFVCIGMLIVGWFIALIFFGKYRRRIAYWL